MYFGIRKGISKYNERKRLRSEYENTFGRPAEHLSTGDIRLRLEYKHALGIEPPGSLSSGEIRNELNYRRNVLQQIEELDKS